MQHQRRYRCRTPLAGLRCVSVVLRRVSNFLFLWDFQRFSENVRKKAGAKREFYAASQIFSENIRDSQKNKKVRNARRVSCFFSLKISENLRNSNLEFAFRISFSLSFSEKSWARFPLACELRYPKFYVRILVEFLLARFALFVRTSENYWAVEVRFSEKKKCETRLRSSLPMWVFVGTASSSWPTAAYFDSALLRCLYWLIHVFHELSGFEQRSRILFWPQQVDSWSTIIWWLSSYSQSTVSSNYSRPIKSTQQNIYVTFAQ